MFSQRLRELRKKRKMTQGELARLTGLSPSAIGMYEQNRRKPDTQTLKRFSEVFSVPVDYLIMNDEEGSPRDAMKAVDDFKSMLKNSNGLMFKGVPLTEEEIKRLADAIELSAKIVLCSEGET